VSGPNKFGHGSSLREHPVRAGIVVTGTEVLSGIIRDANGPWLAERLRDRGVHLVAVHVVGDRPDDLRAGLELFRDLDLVITSGGLGPTADDLTAEVVADFAGSPLVLDEALEERIWRIISGFRERWRDVSEESLRAGNRKQALVPRGASVLEPVGTAPGLVVPVADGPVVLVLPGPPGELQPMWEAAVALPPVRDVLARAGTFEQRIMRVTGVPESQLAEVLREIAPPSSLEITTCLRRGELEIVTVFDPSAVDDYLSMEGAIVGRFGARVFSRDGSTIDDIVAGLLRGPPLRTVAVAESCTGGLMTARLTDRPGSSAYVLGGVTVYSNEAKVAFAGVPGVLIERFGAVSEEVARALAAGAASRFGAALGVGITGIAGPDGGTEDKPVGTVCVCVADTAGLPLIERRVKLPGDRAAVRDRTTTLALHLLRRALLEGRGEASSTAA
jgi:nicotinamide-nucleotide amidase